MDAGETGSDVQSIEESNDAPRPTTPRRAAPSNQTQAWVLTAWMVIAPLLMLITVWLLLVFGR